MSPKIEQDDWERLFAPNAPRRGGPLRVLAYTLLALTLLAVIGFGSVFALSRRDEQLATANANATVYAATMQPQQTATAQAIAQATTLRYEARTATAYAKNNTVIGLGSVVIGGNLRSEPRVAPETTLGILWPGDKIVVFEERTTNGQSWYRIRITRIAPNRAGAGLPVESEGWVSASLLSTITAP